MKYSKSDIDKVNAETNLLATAQLTLQLKKKGKDYAGQCPMCNSTSAFTINPAKEIYKCFSCDAGGKGAISFVQDTMKKTFVEAMDYLIQEYSIIIIPTEKKKKAAGAGAVAGAVAGAGAVAVRSNKSFKDQQMQASGLTDADISHYIIEDDINVKCNRYTAGSINENDWSINYNGDDMIMHYIGLDKKVKTFIQKGKSKPQPLLRVRYQLPEHHTDRDGKPHKYKSPYGSGVHIWLPGPVITAYENKQKIKTLHIQEGEKKADKATKHGITSVGIMGINNIAYDKKLCDDFISIIKNCEVENIAFWVDADFDDFPADPTKPVDQRIRNSFFPAVKNMHDYFYALNNSGINLNIYFVHINKNENNDKGTDDVLTNVLDAQLGIIQDWNNGISTKENKGAYITTYNITGFNEFKIKSLFHIQDVEAFCKHNFEQLKSKNVFTYGKYKYKLKTNDAGTYCGVDLDEPLTPDEIFWKEQKSFNKHGDEQSKYAYNYVGAKRFLTNRKFSRYRVRENTNMLIHTNGNIINEVQPEYIKDYVLDFVENAIRNDEVLELMLRGSRMYLNSDQFNNLPFTQPDLYHPEIKSQSLFFDNCTWTITADGITQQQTNSISKNIWQRQIIKNKVELIPDFIGIETTQNGYFIKDSQSSEQCHFYRFLQNASNFYHEDKQKLPIEKQYMPTDDQFAIIDQHILSKLTAIGYLLHNFKDDNCLKIVAAIDGNGNAKESGNSSGRNGKSILGFAIQEIIPTVYIDGKRKDLIDNSFTFSDVDELTQVIFIDDVRKNFDEEGLFSKVTGRFSVEKKAKDKVTFDKKDSKKIYITSNYASGEGEGDSYDDRKHVIVFSNYYNKNHRPIDDFGVRFFSEWDHNQWNLYYNLAATCIHLFFKYGLIEAPKELIEAKSLRQRIGEVFMDWADDYWDPAPDAALTSNINREVTKEDAYNAFTYKFPNEKKYTDIRKFKKKVKDYCKFKNYILNPGHYDEKTKLQWGGDYKSGGKEYLIINDGKTV